IPGINGIGSKGAVALIKEFGDVENILRNADKLKGKLREKVINGKESAVLSKKLATLEKNVPIEIDFEKLKRKETDWQITGAVFEKYEFKTLLKKYGKAEAPEVISAMSEEKARKSAEGLDYKIVNNEKDLALLINNIEAKGSFAFDTETDGLDTFTANLEAVSISYEKNTGFCLAKELLLKEGAVKELKRIFEDSGIKKTGHNIKYDIEILNNTLSIKVNGVDCDTMLAAYILDPTAGKFNLKYLGAKYFGRVMTTFEDLMDANKSKDFTKVPEKEASNYACQDADITFQLSQVLTKELKEKGLYDIFSKIEVPLIDVLVDLEENGVFIDRDKLMEISVEIEGRLKRLQTEIHVISGEEFNINSPKQLAQILFNKLKLPVLRKTKTGPSTDAEVLEELSGNFEIAQKLLEFRQLTKLKTTYVDVFPELINPKTGRIHASFNQIVTATGRLSSSNPNLQNIPVKSQTGKLMRDVFVAQDKDSLIMSADYSQIELRILAHLSKDPNLMEDFIKDRDVHSATAADIYDVKIEEVTKEMRNAAKTINFGIIYGMSAFGLSKALRIKKNEAQDFIDRYFYKYSGVKRYLDATIEFARKNGYVETLLGRRRFIPDINSLNLNAAQTAERTAINTPVQGTAADIIKAAMIGIHKRIKEENVGANRHLPVRMIMQIHDELVFEIRKDNIETAKAMITEEMCSAVKLDVPLKVDSGAGKSWGEAKG
ncbi:MAG: DNA polymerase I, partial [Candidatus Margulisiibacteriota bacterium]